MALGSDNDRDRPVYMIGVAAQLAGMHPQTLRSYEQKGLVTPQRTSGNTRMYSQADIERLELISQLTDEGINLAGVMRIIDQHKQMDKLEAQIESLRKELKVTRDRLHEMEMRATITSLTKRPDHSKLLNEVNEIESWGDELHD